MTMRRRFFIACRPMAAAVPSTVAASEESTASVTVTTMASVISEVLSSCSYQLSVNPVQWPSVLLELNENTIRIRIGAYRNSRISPMYVPLKNVRRRFTISVRPLPPRGRRRVPPGASRPCSAARTPSG